ncbi:GGDEF domain-containing protein [Bacillus sp. MUM 116]|uniref:sensor domain-containing diguanylate cyclase n=1 Tax=Bacillus sp. MUM 116 TaxID=1678002 RepID=UPI0008F5CCA9|nr:diguanylate cyclase [Bacillus sp. MUM 116]OIK16921.1 GGDEF domain-containing protein [Bacillus sp. MUM 116]
MKTFGDSLIMQNEENRYKRLFHITEKFHSLMDKQSLLREIIVSLEELYPSFTCYLLLSQDYPNQNELPIVDFEYDSENITAMEAYVSGNVKMENSVEEKRSILYAPLKGKQGVYGVLQIIAPHILVFPEEEIEFITLLANAAGGALENAKLYQQSKRVISDLQLINETTHCLNSNLKLKDMIVYMSNQIKHSFQAEEAGFFLITENLVNVTVLPGSTSFFFTKQAHPYIDYLKNKIIKEKESLFFGDLNLPTVNEIKCFRSIMAVPMIQRGILKGFSIVMKQDPYFFSFEAFKLLQSLIHHSAMALTNSLLREELERMIITDHLTKLHSRNYLDDKIQLSMKEDDQGTFILIDIDNFKVINDTYGHQVGDEVLVQVAKIVRVNIREHDVGARWGGEELAIYLPKVTLETGVAIAERLVKAVAECSVPSITVSCGVSYWNKDRFDSYTNLFKRADECLYTAKGTGKNKVINQNDCIKAS